MKKCKYCHILKDFSEFYSHKLTKDKLCHSCKACDSQRNKKYRENIDILERSRKRARERSALISKNPILRTKNRLKKYGFSIEQYNDMFLKQNGKCAICQDFKGHKLHVDHCHKKNTFRGLLCSQCNVGIGYLKEDERILINAIKYIQMSLEK